jgi:putative aldouronate transport system substrate-binding protein
MMFLELLNTDEEIYNLICKGIEGVHWQWKDEENKVIEPVGAESFSEVGWYPNSDWMFGNQFNAYYIDEAQVGAWEGMYELNQNAQVSPALGFTFDREPVEQQLAALSAIGQEFGEPLSRALIEDVDEGLERLWQAQEDAGIKDVQEEMQRQVNAWAAANK